MNNDIKLIMMDMDGTLLNGNGRISEGNKAALKAARAAGIGVTVVTGRMLRATAWVAEELELDLPFSTYNGALITAPKPPYRQELHHRLKDEQVRMIIDLLRPYNTHINAYVDDNLYVEEETPEIIEYARTRDAEYAVVGDFKNIPRMNCSKILIIEDNPEKIEKIRTMLVEKSGAAVFKSTENYIEILSQGINKGTALDFFAERLGITPSQIMAMGDQENDLNMLQKAGFGIAMGNARDEIKAEADWVSAHHHEDGVAAAIRHFLPELEF